MIDCSASVGVNLQFAKIVNEGFDAGPHLNLMTAFRVASGSSLSLWLGFDYVATTFGTETSESDMHAWFIEGGMRFELKKLRSAFNPYLLIGFASGNVNQFVPNGTAYPSISNTAVMFGTGFAFALQRDLDLVTSIRLLVGEGSGVSLPLNVGLRYSL